MRPTQVLEPDQQRGYYHSSMFLFLLWFYEIGGRFLFMGCCQFPYCCLSLSCRRFLFCFWNAGRTQNSRSQCRYLLPILLLVSWRQWTIQRLRFHKTRQPLLCVPPLLMGQDHWWSLPALILLRSRSLYTQLQYRSVSTNLFITCEMQASHKVQELEGKGKWVVYKHPIPEVSSIVCNRADKWDHMGRGVYHY